MQWRMTVVTMISRESPLPVNPKQPSRQLPLKHDSPVTPIQIRIHRRVIGCSEPLLLLAKVPVYPHVGDALGYLRGAEQEVDA